MTRREEYRARLLSLPDWDSYLLQESGLPGPRGNLELAQVVAELGDAALFDRYLLFDASRAPANSPEEFLAFCGAVGLGRLLAEGRTRPLARLRKLAADPRWRTREAVAMALQRWGDSNFDALLLAMEEWSRGTPFEKRAAAAALCEPRLLTRPDQVRRVLLILDRITASMPRTSNRKEEGFQALRKGMGYCWSVAIAALPEEGKRALEKWRAYDDLDIRWIVNENLKKDRLLRMDAKWVKAMKGGK